MKIAAHITSTSGTASKRSALLFAAELATLVSFVNFQCVLPLALILTAAYTARAAELELPYSLTAGSAATFKSSATFNGAALFKGSVTLSGISVPPLSPAGKANIYFNSTQNLLKASENGGAYFDLHTWSGSGSDLYPTTQPGNVLVNTVTALSTFTVVGGVSVSTSATAEVLLFVHASSGAVGIATVNPTERLEVDGNVKAVRYYGDGSQLVNLPTVPLDAIALFDGACPTGWTEYAPAQGRYLVGNPSGGTVTGTLGTAFTNLANASYTPAGAVAAAVFTGNAGTTGAEAAHTHGMQAHTHTTDVAAVTTGAATAHTHTGNTGAPSATINVNPTANWAMPASNHYHGFTTANGSAHSHNSGNPAATASGGPSATDTAAGSSHSHGFTPVGSVSALSFTGTANNTMRSVIAPYIQLRLCKKTGGEPVGNGWQDSVSSVIPLSVSDNVGVGTVSPASKLTIAGGALQMNETTSPGNAPAAAGRLYFDSAANKFKISENGGGYLDLIAGGALGGSGTAGYVPQFSAPAEVTISTIQESASGIGIGRAPGAVGAAQLELYGVSGNLAGPHLQAVTSADDYPVFQQLNWAHDNVWLNFDAYYDGSGRSSDAGSNFRILKNADYLTINYDAGVAAGAGLAWNVGLRMDSAGRVGIGLTPDTTVKLHVGGKLRVENSAVSVNGTDMALIPSGLILLFDGSACPATWTEVSSARSRIARGWNGVAAAGDANIGGSDTHTHNTDVTAFTSGAEAAHTHGYTTGGPSATVKKYNDGGQGAIASGTHTHTGTTSAGSSHSHSINPPSTASSSSSSVPVYRSFLLCKKN